MASLGSAGAFGRAYDLHMARIQRIVEEEFPGCSVVFDRTAWPILRFRIEDRHGTIVSSLSLHFSVAELDGMTDGKLLDSLRKRCRFQRK